MARSRRQVTQAGALSAFAIMLALSASIYALLWTLDRVVGGVDRPLLAPFHDPSSVDSLLGFAEVSVGVLGVAITVVAIIVELAATRYTPRIVELFIGDMTHVTVLSFLVVSSVLVVWINLSLGGPGPTPHFLIGGEVALMSASLLVLLPYFGYVFDFLTPTRVIGNIGSNGIRALDRAAKGRIGSDVHDALVRSIEQLGDIAHKAVQNQDKTIAIAAVSAVGDVLLASVERKEALPDPWFDVYDDLIRDSDFASFHRDVVRRLVPSRTWVEMKGLRQYQSAFTETINDMRDVGHLIAIQTRRLAVRAAEANDEETCRLAMRYLNTFMRAALNARDVRSAYNLLNEYRLLGQGLLGTSQQASLLELAGHMKYYGQLAFRFNLSFILETVAYDLCTLLEVVHAHGAAEHDALLEIFLDVDREPDDPAGAQEDALRGVRKAQIKLATWYLLREERELARRIHQDMQRESPARLRSIRTELERTTDEEYWEISDRGANFDWLEPHRRALLGEFFSWFPTPGAQLG